MGNCAQKEEIAIAETVEPEQEVLAPVKEQDQPVAEPEAAKQPDGVSVVFKVGREEKELIFLQKPLGMTCKVTKGCCGPSKPSKVVISKMKPKSYAEALGIQIGWQVVKIAGEALPVKMTQDEVTAKIMAAVENLPTLENPVTVPVTAAAPAADPAAGKAAEPAADTAAEPAADKAAEPAEVSAAEPAADTAAEPAAEKAAVAPHQ